MPDYVAAGRLRRAVMRFCLSADERLTLDHLPKDCENVELAEKRALAEYARALWLRTIDIDEEQNALPIRDYHVIKYAALQGLTLPDRIHTVVVDESHEMSTPLMQILDASPQAITTFGDRYQRLGSSAPRRQAGIRQRELNQSVRAGQETEDYVNAALDSHPAEAGPRFYGAHDRHTQVNYYTGNAIPDASCTIVVSDLWELFEWFQRLAAHQARFRLLGQSQERLRQFGQDCIMLRREGVRPRDSYLVRYASWEAVQAAESESDAFHRVEKMLDKGYSENDLERSLEMPTEEAPYQLGLLEDVKNGEFDRVMLAPSFGEKVMHGYVDPDFWSKVYIGGTRGRFEMLVPRNIRDWATGGSDGG
jgi:hypothetical protein